MLPKCAPGFLSPNQMVHPTQQNSKCHNNKIKLILKMQQSLLIKQSRQDFHVANNHMTSNITSSVLDSDYFQHNGWFFFPKAVPVGGLPFSGWEKRHV